jgi:hypothetical protein
MNLRSVTAAEVSFFQEHGWAYLPSLVDGDPVTKAREHAQAAFGEQMEFGEIVDRCFYRLPGEDRDGTFSKEIICSATMGDNIIRLLNVSRVRLWTDGPLLKLPEQEGAHDETLYHQDFPGNPYDRSSALTIWIALHDMPAAAGTMRFFNRSHRKGVLGHVFADGVDLRRRCAVLRDEDLSSPLNPCRPRRAAEPALGPPMGVHCDVHRCRCPKYRFARTTARGYLDRTVRPVRTSQFSAAADGTKHAYLDSAIPQIAKGIPCITVGLLQAIQAEILRNHNKPHTVQFSLADRLFQALHALVTRSDQQKTVQQIFADFGMVVEQPPVGGIAECAMISEVVLLHALTNNRLKTFRDVLPLEGEIEGKSPEVTG